MSSSLTDSVVFKALRETFPDTHLAGVVIAGKMLLEHNPYVTKIRKPGGVITNAERVAARSAACGRDFAFARQNNAGAALPELSARS